MTEDFRGWTEEAQRFFIGLELDNSKSYFEAHREIYERCVRGPLLALLASLEEEFGSGRIFRINRDIRFSSDKSPYKTHAAAWFFHGDGSSKVGREAHGGGAGFYFHLEPGKSILGGGCWMPPRPALQKFRVAIAGDPRAFEKIVLAPKIQRDLGGLDDESMLKRAPRGYEEDHPAAKWLKYQSFTVGRRLTDAEVTGGRLTAILQGQYEAILPLVRWLNTTLGLKEARGR